MEILERWPVQLLQLAGLGLNQLRVGLREAMLRDWRLSFIVLPCRPTQAGRHVRWVAFSLRLSFICADLRQ